MTGALIVSGLAVWAAGAALDLIVGARRGWGRAGPWLAGLAGSGCVTAAGVLAVLGAPRTVDLGSLLEVGQTVVRLDGLAGLFLTLCGGLGVALSACLLGWSRPVGRVTGHGTGAGYLMLLGAVTVIIVAGDAFTFLFGWETLTVAFYVLTGIRRHDLQGSRASWLTFGVGKFSGAALLFGFLLLAGRSGSFTIAAWGHVPPGAVHDAAFVLAVVGFGAKVGLVPFQVWMPVGYPAAPGPLRAVLAGLAANVGFYGLWRILGVLGRPPLWLAVAVLLAGGVTALVGITFAAVQSRLGRVIAYSSVENAGVIAVGYGVALAGAATGQVGVVAVGMLAASLQVLAHAVAKSSLFAAAAFVGSDHGTDDLDRLSGVGRRHPWSGAALAAGSLTLAGLPPTIGFVSEWFILEALMQEFRLHQLALRLAMAAAAALVALTAGVAALTFARLVGMTVLGRPWLGAGAPAPAPVHEGGVAGRGGLAVLAVCCLATAAFAPWMVRFIARGLAPVVPAAAVDGALKSPWVLQPVFADFSILSPTWLFITMPIAFAVVGAFAIAASRGGVLRFRRVPAWRSATSGVAGPDRYSSFGYANIARHVLGNVLGARRSTTAVAGGVEAGGSPAGATGGAAARRVGAHIEVSSRVVEPIETYLYRPARALLLAGARRAKRLQSGRLDAYIAYMLFALMVVLVVAAAAG
ncbi:MAG: proton-conducting transporter membrane subunit [Acidimicrobiales bacterium]